jgi:hypothetical protein
MKRRKFLAISLGAATLTVASTSGCSQVSSVSKQARSQYRSRKLLNQSPTGSLSQEVLDTLKTTTTALIAFESIEISRYESFFKWHAENCPGYKELYENFVASVKHKVEKMGASSFAEMDRAEQLEIINQHKFTSKSQLPGKLGVLTGTLFKRDQMLYESFLFREILVLFARTHALTIAGYDQWIGVPRGLESYHQEMPA